MPSYIAHEYYNEEYNMIFSTIVDYAIKRKQLSVNRIDKNKAKLLWNAFMNNGFVPERFYNTLDDIAENIVKNIARLDINNLICGRTPFDPKVAIKDDLEIEIDDDTLEFLVDSVYDKETNEVLISDYGLKPLQNVAMKIMSAKTPEERIVACDGAFNVIHINGNLATLFILGGRSALDELFDDSKKVTEKNQIKKYSEYINESISSIFDIKYTYTDMVRSKLVDIMMQINRISEKSFKQVDDLVATIKDLVSGNDEVKAIIKNCESEDKRTQLCAELIYDQIIKNKK